MAPGQMRRAAYARYARSLAPFAGLLAISLASCNDRLTTEPVTEKADETIETPISVTGAVPSEAEQRQTLEVRILGTGFPDDAVPVWERHGVADSAVAVAHVVVVSATELRATITIAPDAEPGSRDISVFSNKKGIGSESRGTGEELFLVKEYTPTPLSFLTMGLWSGTAAYASAINDHGVVAGGNYAEGVQFATYWSPADGPQPIPAANPAYASGINNRGWIVGWSAGGAFLLENGVVTYLQGIDGPGSASTINDAGTIVGSSQGKPVVWHRRPNGTYGSPTELPRLIEQPGESVWASSGVSGINARGDVVGDFWRSPMQFVLERVAVLWRAGPGGSYHAPLVLGRSVNSSASGINDAGWIVGTLSGPGETMRAVLWHPQDYGSPVSLSDPGSIVETYAGAINNHGQIVGTQRRDGIYEVGRLWTVNEHGALIATTPLLPLTGYESVQATAINDAGWIAGHSRRVYGFGYVPPPNPLPGVQATLWRPDM